MAAESFTGTFREFVEKRPRKRVLEINQAGTLSRHLARFKGHVLRSYPDIDMQTLPYADGTFDLVVHSDTLEHVPDPVRALSECRRVLAPNGVTCFTVPMIVGRLTRSRAGLVAAYHLGSSEAEHVLVHTEFGADIWCQVIQAGFVQCCIHAIEFPAGLAIIARANGS
jgi:SAM-dependent methyltransferase